MTGVDLPETDQIKSSDSSRVQVLESGYYLQQAVRNLSYHLYENFFVVLAITPNELTGSKQNAIVNGRLRRGPVLMFRLHPLKVGKFL
jgi:hypothetical protein